MPPLHPRCRCAIMYREVGTPRVMQPKPPRYNSSEQGETPRTLTEVQVVAEKLNSIVGKYFVRKSKLNGQVAATPRKNNCKLPDCSLGILLTDCPDEAILHELIHAHSTSWYPNSAYIANSAIEEASVQYLTQEIANLEGVPLIGSGYDFWVERLRKINRMIGLYETDLKFAQRLLRVPMTIRIEWLIAKVRKKLIQSGGTIEQMAKVTELLDEITWETLDNELP